MKKFIFFAICFITFCSARAYDFESNGFYYNILSYDDLSVEVTSGNNKYSGDIVIPEEVVYNRIPFTVTTIGPNAFYGCNVTSIDIPESVTKLGDYCLSNCSGLTEFTIPHNVTFIGFSILQNTILKKLVFEEAGESLTFKQYYTPGNISTHSNISPFSTAKVDTVFINRNIIEESGSGYYGNEYLFYNNKTIKCAIIGDAVTKLPFWAFKQSSLESCYIGNNIKSTDAFNYCASLKHMYVGNGMKELSLYKDDGLEYLYIFSDKITSIEGSVPSTLNTIFASNVEKIGKIFPNNYICPIVESLNSPLSEYSGLKPEFSFKNNLKGFNLNIIDESVYIDPGIYSHNIKVGLSSNLYTSYIEIPVQYTITKAPLIIKPNDISVKYMEEIPNLTCTYKGFKNEEDSSILDILPSIKTSATSTSEPGIYKIIATGAESKKYNITYEDGLLTILDIKVADISLNYDNLKLNGIGSTFQLEATIYPSNATNKSVTWKSSNESVCLVSNGKVVGVGIGKCVIIAVSEDGNYMATCTVEVEEPIENTSLKINLGSNGSISQDVVIGKKYCFEILPDYGWKVHSVSFNSEDISESVNDNILITPAITGPTTIFVTYVKDEESSIKGIESFDFSIIGNSQGITIKSSLKGQAISIYNINGELVHRSIVSSSLMDIKLPCNNIYVIKYGCKTMKLSI